VTAEDTPLALALAAASTHAGEVFLVPTVAGYLCTGLAAIPQYTSLCGVFRAPPRGQAGVGPANAIWGSALLTTANAGSTDTTKPFLTLQRGAVLANLLVYHPNQTKTNPPVAYPPTVSFAGGAGQEQASIVNVLLVNPYFGVRCVNHQRPYIKGLYMQCLANGLVMDQVFDTPRVEDLDIWSYWKSYVATDPLETWVRQNGLGVVLERVDGLQGQNWKVWGMYGALALAATSGWTAAASASSARARATRAGTSTTSRSSRPSSAPAARRSTASR
jgi:hypothetical protein